MFAFHTGWLHFAVTQPRWLNFGSLVTIRVDAKCNRLDIGAQRPFYTDHILIHIHTECDYIYHILTTITVVTLSRYIVMFTYYMLIHSYQCNDPWIFRTCLSCSYSGTRSYSSLRSSHHCTLNVIWHLLVFY